MELKHRQKLHPPLLDSREREYDRERFPMMKYYRSSSVIANQSERWIQESGIEDSTRLPLVFRVSQSCCNNELLFLSHKLCFGGLYIVARNRMC